MTIRDTINNLPWYKRSAVDALINEWDKENKITRYLQGAGNREALEAFIADFDNQNWEMFEGPVDAPEQPETDEETPEVPDAVAPDRSDDQ